MKTISLIAAMEILKNCAAVSINHHGLCYPALYEDSEDFLVLSYEDDCFDGGCAYYNFNQTDNREEVKIEACYMFLIDDNGNTRRITILTSKNIEDSEQ